MVEFSGRRNLSLISLLSVLVSVQTFAFPRLVLDRDTRRNQTIGRHKQTLGRLDKEIRQPLNAGTGHGDDEEITTRKNSILARFLSPQIDDPGLPLTDVLVAQVIAPSLQVAWLSLRHAPQPSWLRPLVDTSVLVSKEGVFLAPALIHGAALAFCWLVGALAARAYERSAISPVRANGNQWDYSRVVKAILQSGAFATGILILSTQVDLFLEYGRYVQVGESEEIDFRLLVAVVELINDVVFEAVTITTWRLFLAYQTERMNS